MPGAEPSGHPIGDGERARHVSENLRHHNRTEGGGAATRVEPSEDLLHQLQSPVDGGRRRIGPRHHPRLQSRGGSVAGEKHFTNSAEIFLVQLVVLQVFDSRRAVDPLHLRVRCRSQLHHRHLRRRQLLQVSVQQQRRNQSGGVHTIFRSVGNLKP